MQSAMAQSNTDDSGATLGTAPSGPMDLSDTWKYSAGFGVASHSKYPGSSQTRTLAAPMFSARYGRYFIGAVPEAGVPAGAGAYLLQNEHWRAGVGLGFNLQKPRKESDSVTLRGLGDIQGTTLGAAFASYDDKWFRINTNVVTDIGGKNQGTRLSMNIDGKYSPTDRLTLTAGPGFTWADSKYNQTFFGINAAQSTQSGRTQYTLGSGINTVRFGVGANYRLTSQWSVGARLTAENLRGDAAGSPLTEKKSQNSVGLFTSYQF